MTGLGAWETWKKGLCQIGRASDNGTLYELCAWLHQAARELSPHVDAFYVCLWEPNAPHKRVLHFVYNYDDRRYDDPCYETMGDGPTSFVVRTEEPFFLTTQTRCVHDAGIDFGKTEKVSASAVHLPMRVWQNGEASPTLWGVCSAQSYTPGLWAEENDGFMTALQARADDAASYWHGLQNERAAHTALQEAHAVLDVQTAQKEADSRHFVQILFELGKQLEEIRPLLPPGSLRLQNALDAACRLCHRRQTEISVRSLQKPAVPAAVSETAAVVPIPPAALTGREGEVWVLLRAGMSNAQIAEKLSITESTVKFHCENIRKKTGQGRTRVFGAVPLAVPLTAKPDDETE